MIPVRRLLGQSIYHLHWSPETFWRATPHEVYAAMEAAGASAEPQSREDDKFKPSERFLSIRNAALERERRAKMIGASQ